MSANSPSDVGYSREVSPTVGPGKESSRRSPLGGASGLGRSGTLAQRRMLQTPLAKLEAADHASKRLLSTNDGPGTRGSSSNLNVGGQDGSLPTPSKYVSPQTVGYNNRSVHTATSTKKLASSDTTPRTSRMGTRGGSKELAPGVGTRMLEIFGKEQTAESDCELYSAVKDLDFFSMFQERKVAISAARMCQCRLVSRGELLWSQDTGVADNVVYIVVQGAISVRTDPKKPINNHQLHASSTSSSAPSMQAPPMSQHSNLLPPLHSAAAATGNGAPCVGHSALGSKESIGGGSNQSITGTPGAVATPAGERDWHCAAVGSVTGPTLAATPSSAIHGGGYLGGGGGGGGVGSSKRNEAVAGLNLGEEVSQVGEGGWHGGKALMYPRFPPHVRVTSGIVTSAHAVILVMDGGAVLSSPDISVGAVIASRVPRIARTPAMLQELKGLFRVDPSERGHHEVEAIYRHLRGQPLVEHALGLEAVKSLCKNMRLLSAEPRHVVMWHEGSATSDNRQDLHILLEGKVDVYVKGSNVDPVVLRSIKWNSDEEPSPQIVGKLRYSLTAGDVFGGPAVSSKVGPSPADTMVSHPGAVIASVDRSAWKAAFGTKHRVFSYQPHRIRKMLARCHSSRPEYSKIDSDGAKLEDVGDKGAGERPAPGTGEGVVGRAVLGIADRSASGTGAGADRTISGTFERMGSVDEGGGVGVESSRKVDKNLVKELCKGLQFFAQVPYENLERIQDRISLVRVPQGDSLCTQGSACQGVFVILSGVGSVRESKHRSDSPADDAFLSLQGMYGTMDFDSTNAAHFTIATPAVNGGGQFSGGNGAQGAQGGAGRGRIESIDEESHNLDGTMTDGGGVGLLSKVATGGDCDDEPSDGGMSLLGLSRVVDPGTDLKTLDYGKGIQASGGDKRDKHPHHEFYSPHGSIQSRSVASSVERRSSRRSSVVSNNPKGNRASYRWTQSLASSGNTWGIGADPDAMFGREVKEVYPGESLFYKEVQGSEPEYPCTVLAKGCDIEAIFIDVGAVLELVPKPTREPVAKSHLHEMKKILVLSPEVRKDQDLEILYQHFRTIPEFQRIPRPQLLQVAKIVMMSKFEPGECLSLQGQPSHVWYGILEGSVSVHAHRGRAAMDGVANSEHFVHRYGRCLRLAEEGETLNGPSFLAGADNLLTSVSREATVLLVIQKARLSGILFEHVKSAVMRPVKCSDLMLIPPNKRTEFQIQCIASYMLDNPFFARFDPPAIMRLAIRAGIVFVSKGDLIAPSDGADSLLIVNLGSVSVFATAESMKRIRFMPGDESAKRTAAKKPSNDQDQQQHQLQKAESSAATATTAAAAATTTATASDVAGDGTTVENAEGASPPNASLNKNRDGTIGGDGAGGTVSAVSRGGSNVSRGASSSVGGGSPALTPMGTSATLGGGSKAKILRPLATYGQAFWGGQPVIADEESEIITLPRKKWAQTTNTAEKGASLDATAFLFSHPLFAGCTKSEMAQVLTGVKVMSLDQMTLLFRAGQSVPDVYLVRQGEIELRTELEIHRDDLSAGERHVIPSATVASMGRNAVVNDVPDEAVIESRGMQIPEILSTWMSQPERHSAIVVAKATVISVAKSHLVDAQRRHLLSRLRAQFDTFHIARKKVISRAHHGILNGKNLTGWRAEDRRRRADLGDTIKVMRKKTYAKNQPVVALDPRGKTLLEKLAHGEGAGAGLASSLEVAGGEKGQAPLENAATDYLRLPRPMHHRDWTRTHDPLHPADVLSLLRQRAGQQREQAMNGSNNMPEHQQVMASTRQARTTAYALAAATKREAARPENVRKLNMTELHMRMAGLKLNESQMSGFHTARERDLILRHGHAPRLAKTPYTHRGDTRVHELYVLPPPGTAVEGFPPSRRLPTRGGIPSYGTGSHVQLPPSLGATNSPLRPVFPGMSS